MYTPSVDRINDFGVEGSTIRYDELIELVVQGKAQLGNLSMTNDLEWISHQADHVGGIHVTRSEQAVVLTVQGHDATSNLESVLRHHRGAGSSS